MTDDKGLFGRRPVPYDVNGKGRSDEETRANAEKYARDMGPAQAARLLADRAGIVRDLMDLGRQGQIDSLYDRWYRPEDWVPGRAKGEPWIFIGDLRWFDELHPDAEGLVKLAQEKATAEVREAERQRKLAVGRAALAGVEARLGVKPVVTPPAPAETKIAGNSVSEDNLVSKTGSETKLETKIGRGRPSLGEPWVAAGISKAEWYRRKGKEGK